MLWLLSDGNRNQARKTPPCLSNRKTPPCLSGGDDYLMPWESDNIHRGEV